jgi:hypothetical protein
MVGMNKNKRGWITVLEATIAVMLVSGVLVVVYTKQGTDDSPIQDYIFSLQKQVLSDIAFRADLRAHVLEKNETALNDFVSSKVPPAYRYSLKICELDSTIDHCKLNTTEVTETREKNIFSDEIIISSDLGDGTSAPIYSPMKARLFIWEDR